MICNVSVCVDGGVNAVEDFEKGEGWGGEQAGVCCGQGVVVLAPEVGYVVVGSFAVLAGVVSGVLDLGVES